MATIYLIVSLVATLGMGYLAGYLEYRKAKAVLDSVTKLLIEINTAMKDDKLTRGEIAAVHQKIRDLISVLKG